MRLILSLRIGGAVLRYTAAGWDMGETLGLAGCVLAISLLPILWPSRRGRSFSLGFALGGWAYLVLSLGPGLDPPEVTYLPTAPLLDAMYEWVYPDTFITDEAVRREYCSCPSCVEPLREHYRRHFLRVGHAGASILVAATVALATQAFSVCLDRLRCKNVASAA
jgi:hypothetical protein